MRLAIVRAGKVVTFVRSDTPPGWSPPMGTSAVPESELPKGWELENAHEPEVPPLVTKTKLQISDRMTEAEFDGVETLMDSLMTSEDAGQRRMAKRWRRAVEVDPNDPETAAGLSALVAMGVITTPLHVIFAP